MSVANAPDAPWPTVQMNEICQLHYGKALTATKRRPGSIPVYGSNGITGWHDTPLTKGPTVILGRKGQGPLGVEWCDEPFWVIDTAYYTTFADSVFPKFFYYFTDWMGLNHLKDGTSNPSLTRDVFGIQDFPLPSLAEQREIAAVLGALDDKIELNRKTAATLEEMARALYRSWFVNFDPVTAKSEGRAPAHMPPTTAALFPDRFGEDGLPEGWEAGTLGDLIDFNPREKITKGSDAPYLDMKALPTSGMTADPAYKRAFTSGTKFRVGDTLLARITPCLENGKTAMVDDLLGSEVGWGSTEFIVMRGKSGVPSSLPYCVARDSSFREEAIATMTGSSGRQRADAGRISQVDCAVPPRPTLSAFAEATDPMIRRIHALGKENQTLATLRDTLLPRLMSGDLRVGAARDQVEAVA